MIDLWSGLNIRLDSLSEGGKMKTEVKLGLSIMVVIFAAGIILLATGCSTVSTKTLEYCDKDYQKFLFIPYDISENCVGISVDGAQGNVELPLREPDV